MICVSLFVSAVIGAIAVALGSTISVFAALLATALVCSLICVGIVQKLLSDIRVDQLRVLDLVAPEADLPEANRYADDISVIILLQDAVTRALESQQKERRYLVAQISSVQEKLKSTMLCWSTGDEKEAEQMRDAVLAMEQLNSGFSHIIAELDELSNRTDERASISTQMSATTDEIAENISQYSKFVLETSGSIEKMAHASRETAKNIQALSLSTEQTVSSINTISISQSSVRENSERSAAASASVRTQAQHGLRCMTATMKAMQEIAKSNDDSFDSINRLSRHSARVGEFLSVIQEVVEQTNLLSLNASIIAAQAGSRGRAFAVVAEEVRSLARRTSASTREIEELVRNIQKETSYVQRSVTQGKDRVKEGVKISGLANEALGAIDTSAEDAYRMVSSIAVETTEQAVNINRITEGAERNLERVQQVTRATEHQQQGSMLVVQNLERMRELANRINLSAQEQAKGNRLYLKNVMEDNERARELKITAAQHNVLAKQSLEASRTAEIQISTHAVENRIISESLKSLTALLDRYRSEAVPGSDEKRSN
jgi:methyl-accepting chemotaxis protein